MRRSLAIFIAFFLLSRAHVAFADPCAVHDLASFKDAIAKAQNGECTTNSVEYRNRYGEFYIGVVNYQVVKWESSVEIDISNSINIQNSGDEPLVIVADDGVAVELVGSGAQDGFILSGERIIVDNLTIRDFSQCGIVIEGDSSLVIGSRLLSNGNSGISITGKENRVVGSEIAMNGINGVIVGDDSDGGGRETKILGSLIHDNGGGVKGSSCNDISPPDSINSCKSLKLETEACYRILSADPDCDEPSTFSSDNCSNYWKQRNRCEDLWQKAGILTAENLSLSSALSSVYNTFPGAHGGAGMVVNAQDVEIRPWRDVNEGGIYNNKYHGVYVNSLPASLDLSSIRTAIISETPVDDIFVSRFPLPTFLQVATNSSDDEVVVSGSVRLTRDLWYPWNESTVSYSFLKAEVFARNSNTEIQFVGSSLIDGSGRFTVHLPPGSGSTFYATLVDTEYGNTSPISRSSSPGDDVDDDNDGISSREEDSNQDGVISSGETDPLNPDTDEDGLTDGEEKAHSGLDPLSLDSDDDCLPDGLEMGVTEERVGLLAQFMPEPSRYELTEQCRLIFEDGESDEMPALFDLDPVSKTEPTVADTDGDGLRDGEEDRNFNGLVDEETDPNSADSDEDGIIDGHEGDKDGDGEVGGSEETSPLLADTDGDGVIDGEEMRLSTFPNQCDTDNDGLSDGVEMGVIRPTEPGSDCHGLEAAGTNFNNPSVMDPLNSDSDGDGLRDGDEDENGNGWVDTFESDPSMADTDHDGLSDGIEKRGDFNGDGLPDFEYTLIQAGLNCSPPEGILDVDCDGLPNWIDIDSDDDGCPDSEEGGRRDQNNNGLPDVFDNEAEVCSVAETPGGGVSFSSGSASSESDDSNQEGGVGETPEWLTDPSGGGACSLIKTKGKRSDNAFFLLLSFLALVVARIKFRYLAQPSDFQR